MRQTVSKPQPSRVTVLFADHARYFVLPKRATLGDLAARLEKVRNAKPIAVTVRLHS